jgi:adenine deaminase
MGGGCSIAEPFPRLKFRALAVMPQLNITDVVLFDLDHFELIAD